MKKVLKNTKGITLVALIITIIILLILVGVTISNLGEKGLIDKTEKSTDEYKISSILESLELEKTNLTLDKEGNMPSVAEYIEYLKNKEIIAASDVDDIDEDSKNIIVDKYIFLVEKEASNNIKIIYQGKTDGLTDVSSITLSKTALRIKIGETDTLTATVSPTNVRNKTVSWKSSNESVATIDSKTGEVTAIARGTAIITATANDGSGITANCSLTVLNITYSWDELASIAKIISNTSSITSDTETATVTLNGETKTLKVGDTTTVDGKLVRILGFNHDDLTSSTAYDSTTATGKAGISFEYVDFLTSARMDIGGNANIDWVDCELREILNGESYYGALSIKNYIKQVNKQYHIHPSESMIETSSDYLWLLSCGEIWDNGQYGGNYRGYTKVCEGSQYEYYKLNLESTKYNSVSSVTEKEGSWWLRSPYTTMFIRFCIVNTNGSCNVDLRYYTHGIAPGFCI